MGRLKYTVIKTNTQYDEYCSILEQFRQAGPKLSKTKKEEGELLMVLIKHWNDTQSKYRFGDPPEALKKLMEKHKMKTSTLMRILDIDSRSLISDILNYKKGFSKKVIWKLSIHFNVPQETFNRPYKLKSESEAESQRNQIYEGNDFEDVWGMHGAW